MGGSKQKRQNDVLRGNFNMDVAPYLLKRMESKMLNPDGKITSVVIVISPLNDLIKNQIDRLSLNGTEAAVLDVKSSASIIGHDDGNFPEEEAVVWEFQFGTIEKLEKVHYNIVFAHSEFIISSKDGRKLMQSIKKMSVVWNGKLDGNSYFKTLMKIQWNLTY